MFHRGKETTRKLEMPAGLSKPHCGVKRLPQSLHFFDGRRIEQLFKCRVYYQESYCSTRAVLPTDAMQTLLVRGPSSVSIHSNFRSITSLLYSTCSRFIDDLTNYVTLLLAQCITKIA
jgi:hypothetical protein